LQGGRRLEDANMAQELTPLVSVIVPAYDAVMFIADAVRTVLAQSFKNFELIVVNDGSPDTAALEAALAPYWGNIVYLTGLHKGAAAARNAGLRMARGMYVAFLDADDTWLPNYLENQIAFLSAHPEIDLVYCNAMVTGSSPLAGRTFMETAPSRGPVTAESLLSLRCHVIASGVVVRRSIVMAAGLFNETIRRGHDFDLWVRLACRGARLAYQRKVLMIRRIHDHNLSGDALDECERALTGLRRIDRTLPLSVSERAALKRSTAVLHAQLELERGKRFLRNRDFPAACNAVALANRMRPRLKVRAMLMALRIAPSWLHWIDQARQRRVSARPSGDHCHHAGPPQSGESRA
jgi:glycosyltransferase involved in cell wall biosynthesis